MFEEQTMFVLGPGEIKRATVRETDCLVAKVGNEVISQLGVCAAVPDWRLSDNRSKNGCHCPFVVENHRAEPVNIFCTGGNAESLMIRILDPGAQAVLESFKGDYWKAMIGDRVVSAYQPSERLPVCAITEVDCNFVRDLPKVGNENLNETSEPRPIDQVAHGDVRAVMVFVDFADVQGTVLPMILSGASSAMRRIGLGRNPTDG